MSTTDERRRDWLLAAGAGVLAAIPRLAAFPVSNLNMHAARDLHRTMRLVRFEQLPLSGPELYFGGAVPGNFYYWLQAVPLFLWQHPYAVAVWIALLNAAAAAITFLAVRMVARRAAAVTASVAFALFPLAVIEGIYMWNPSYLPFFNAVGLWGLCYWIARGRGAGIAVMLTASFLAMQIHLSAYVIAVAAVGALAAGVGSRVSGTGYRVSEVGKGGLRMRNGESGIGTLNRREELETQGTRKRVEHEKGESALDQPVHPIPDSRFPIPADTRYPTPDARFPIPVSLSAAHFLLPLVIALPFVFPYLWARGEYYFLDLNPPSEPNAKVGLFSSTINPFAFEIYPKAFVFQDDSNDPQQFIHFRRFFAFQRERSHTMHFLSRDVAQVASALGMGLFAGAGAGALVCALILPARTRVRECVLESISVAPESARRLAVGLLLWLLVPLVVLLKLVGFDASRPIAIPTRYVVILYPVAMVVIGIGFAWLWGFVKAGWMRVAASIVFGTAQFFHALVLVLFIAMAYRTYGAFNSLLPPFANKPLFLEAEVSRFLADKYQMRLEDFRERFQTDGNFADFVQEQYLDFELFAGRGEERAGAPADLWFYFHDTRWNAEPPPLIAQSGPVIDTRDFGPFRLLVIRRADDSKPMPWPLGQLETPMVY